MARDRKTPHAIVGPGGALVFAGILVLLALGTRAAEYEAPGFATGLPPGGIAVLWLLLRGARVVSWDAGLLLLVSLGANLLLGSELELAAALAVAVLVQTVLAVLLLRRWCPDLWGCGGDRPLDRPRALARFGAAIVLGMAVGAALATVSWTVLRAEELDLGGLLWFGRNACSAFIIVTFGLLLGERLTLEPPRPRLLGGASSWAELFAAVVFTLGMYALAFTFDTLPLAFPLLAATVWVGLRFSTVLSAAHSCVTGVLTMGLTMAGIGPFAAVDRVALGCLLAEFYVATMIVTGLGLSTGRDEREALAAELRRTKEEADYQASVRQAVIGSMNEGLFVLDDRGDVLLHNAAAAEIFGLTEAELTRDVLVARSDRWADGTSMRDADRPSIRALAGETVREAEILVRAGEQPERVVAVSAIPLPRDERRGRARALVLFRDTTLEHARREELAAFAGVVAHDLRNPLAAIDGWTEMIADELDSGGLDAQLAREFVSRVRSSSRRMRELIRDLLAHATSSARDLEVSRIDVAVLVAEIASARHAEKNITCDPVPPVLADPVLVRQVLDNLIGNALKYVATGVEPRIAVHGCHVEPGFVTIRVADNGIGIPAGERELIFDEFHRAHYRDYEGSGLGLSIVRRIIARHDGTIVALPNPDGPGSMFEFTLPAYDA